MIEGEYAAIARAWDFQKEAGITDVPVPIEKYLVAANAELRISHKLRDDEAGQTFQLGERHIIVVNGRDTPARQRFTVLHELAHIKLSLPSKHGQSISVSDLLRYRNRPREEILCDVFASECLLPRQFFIADVRKRSCTFATIEELAELYCASLAATGSRFAAYSETPCAWVLADDRRVRYVTCSPSLREAGFFVKLGIEVPARSVLGRLASNDATVRPGVAELVPSYIWVNNDCGEIEEFSETAVLAPALSQGLSFLCAEDSERPARSRPETSSDDGAELLSELDGVLRFPGRKGK